MCETVSGCIARDRQPDGTLSHGLPSLDLFRPTLLHIPKNLRVNSRPFAVLTSRFALLGGFNRKRGSIAC